MAKASTTHVIEIESGSGEPAFIALTLGQELQPISIGKKGMWRIDSAQVLDVHAFVYFDGTALFIQSADESAAASVAGYRVGKAWTELHAPCTIEVGSARLRFRTGLPGEAPGGHPPRPHPSPAGQPPGHSPTPRQRVDTSQGRHGQATARPREGAPAERPFAPGEFSTGAPIVESTRLVPMETPRGAGGSMAPAGSMPPAPRAITHRGVDEREKTRMEGSGRGRVNTGPVRADREDSIEPAHHLGTAALPSRALQNQTEAMPNGPPVKASLAPPPVMPSRPPHGHQYPSSMPPPGMAGSIPPVQPAFPSTARGHHPTGPFQPPYATPSAPPPYSPSGRSATGPHGGPITGAHAPPESGFAQYLAKYKELSPPKRILVVLAPFCLLASAYLVFFDEAEPPLSPHTVLAGPGPGAATTPAATTPAPAASCPAGYVPWTAPAANGAISCVPANAPAISPAAAPSPAPGPAASPTGAAPNGDAAPPSTRTLERQAVDYVAANDYAHAAAVYEQLLAQNPQNRVYAEAARILREKANPGAP